MSSLGVLHQGVPSAASVASSNGPHLSRALLVIAYAPRTLKCSCGARCCAGSYPNPEWADAMRVLLAHVAPLLAGHAANEALHSAIMRTH